MGRHRNLLLIVADHWRGDCLGALGHPAVRTPNLDALARRSMIFTRHFCQSAPCGSAWASLPTVLDALGLPLPRTLDGVPLTPWLRGETLAAWRDAVHCEYDLRGGWPDPRQPPFGLGVDEVAMCAIRTAAWKYVHFAALPPLLYDLRADPGETRNLAADPAQAGLLAEARDRMLSWRMRLPTAA